VDYLDPNPCRLTPGQRKAVTALLAAYGRQSFIVVADPSSGGRFRTRKLPSAVIESVVRSDVLFGMVSIGALVRLGEGVCLPDGIAGVQYRLADWALQYQPFAPARTDTFADTGNKVNKR
jgi:hypothetical protein